MVVDLIYHRYRGTMVDFNGNEFQVDWAAADPAAADFETMTPFRSGIWADTRPYWIGDVGEIPARFYPPSRQVVPPRVCLSCFVGLPTWWESGWPVNTPPVTLEADGWPFGCQANEILVNACICWSPSAETDEPQHDEFTACDCLTASATITPGADYVPAGCFAWCATLNYDTGPDVSAEACFAWCSEVTEAPGSELATVGCIAQCATLEYITTMPLTTFGCATLAATGATQGTAAAIADDNVLVQSSALSQSGVQLPVGCYRIFVANDAASSNQIFVYPQVGGEIGTHGTNNPLIIFPANSFFFCNVPGTDDWYCVQLNG